MVGVQDIIKKKKKTEKTEKIDFIIFCTFCIMNRIVIGMSKPQP